MIKFRYHRCPDCWDSGLRTSTHGGVEAKSGPLSDIYRCEVCGLRFKVDKSGVIHWRITTQECWMIWGNKRSIKRARREDRLRKRKQKKQRFEHLLLLQDTVSGASIPVPPAYAMIFLANWDYAIRIFEENRD